MAYHTLAAWQTLLTKKPAIAATQKQWFLQILCDFEARGYPNASQLSDPLVQAFKDWVLYQQRGFWPFVRYGVAIFKDGAHYQRVGDLAARLSEKLDLPQIHPGYEPAVDFRDARTVEFQVEQRIASWQTPETHRGWLQALRFGWARQATELGVATAWPLFLHYLQWGVIPEPKTQIADATQLLVAPDKWQGLPAESSFLTWCFLQWATQAPVTVDAWLLWAASLQNKPHWLRPWRRKHAAHTLDVGRAFQVYDLWATLQAPGQPPNWLSLLQMVEPALAVAPTGEGPVADTSPIDLTL